MSDTKTLAADIAAKITYTPTDDRLLVKPLKPVMVTKELPVVPKQQGAMQDIEETEVKLEKRKVEANMRKGIVIKLGPDYAKSIEPTFGVGDIVIYPALAGVNFELLKDSRLLRRYEVVAYEPAA